MNDNLLALFLLILFIFAVLFARRAYINIKEEERLELASRAIAHYTMLTHERGVSCEEAREIVMGKYEVDIEEINPHQRL